MIAPYPKEGEAIRNALLSSVERALGGPRADKFARRHGAAACSGVLEDISEDRQHLIDKYILEPAFERDDFLDRLIKL